MKYTVGVSHEGSPFHVIVNEGGAVIAMRVMGSANAERIARLLEADDALLELDWARAEQHLGVLAKTCKKLSGQPGINMFFYAGVLSELLARFDGGERSQTLFDAIMELE